MLKQAMIVATVATMGVMMCGCASTGLTEEEKNTAGVEIWYDNATLLAKANDPDLRVDVKIGIPSVDAVVNTVKDVTGIAPQWVEAKVEEMHFEGMFMESAKALNAGSGDAELTVKCEAFKTALLLDSVASEKAVTTRDGGEALDAALALRDKYTHEQIFPLLRCEDDADRRGFFETTSRQWDAETDRIVALVRTCVDEASKEKNDKATAAAKERLFRRMGVQKYDWGKVGQKLAEDIVKLQKASADLAVALADPALQQKMVKAGFGGEIVEGVSGKETLAALDCFRKQLTVSIELLTWLTGAIVTQ